MAAKIPKIYVLKDITILHEINTRRLWKS